VLDAAAAAGREHDRRTMRERVPDAVCSEDAEHVLLLESRAHPVAATAGWGAARADDAEQEEETAGVVLRRSVAAQLQLLRRAARRPHSAARWIFGRSVAAVGRAVGRAPRDAGGNP
jgi:hypothetical protein